MSCSDARRLANQRNAQKSTGPTTLAGKMVARLNALTHGLRAEAGLAPPHLSEAVAKHEADLYAAYRPEGSHQRWLLAQVADAAAKLDHCQIMIRAEIDDMADRADLCWNEDHDRAVEEVATRLTKDPARTARRLRETSRGCRWILARWDALSVPLTENVGWDETQCNLAAHLMGVGPDLRASYPKLKPDADVNDLLQLASEQADEVHLLMVEALEPLDAKERELTRLGYPLRPSKELLRFQRYETRLRRVWNEAMTEFRRVRAEGFTGLEPITCLEPEPIVEPARPKAPEPTSVKEFEPEPSPPPSESSDDEFGVSKLAALVKTLAANADRHSAPSLASSMPKKPSTPMNRRARRAQAAAARKVHASAR
ncbi:MAG: hypothetical protein ABI353_06730 [Isosphaeraceae bacterium]